LPLADDKQLMKTLKILALILALVCVSQAQTIVTQFDGITGNGGSSPNVVRSTMASNGTQLLEINGQTVTYYTTAGSQISTFTFTAWLAAVSPTISCGLPLDPRGYYDSFISRWIVVQSCSSGDWMIVSDGSSLTSPTWKAVAFGGPLGANGDLTMRIGFDKNGVYVQEFNATETSPNDYDFYGLPNADVAWTGGGSPSIANVQTFTGLTHFAMCGIDLNASKAATDPEFCASYNNPNSTSNTAFNWLIDQFTWPSLGVTGACTNGAGSTRCMSKGTQQSFVSNYKENLQVNEPQPTGNPLQLSESARIGGVREFGTHLYIVRPTGPCTSSCGTQGVDSHNLFFWVDFNISTPTAITVAQTAKVSSAGQAYHFPTIAVDSSGNLLIVAGGNSSSIYPTIYSWYRLTSDTANTLHGPNVVTSGTNAAACNSLNPVPWGTYYEAVTDASDATKLWAVNQYGKSAVSCTQQTRLIEFQLAAPGPPAGPTPTGNFSSVQIWGAVQ
jgi:hypothetical protein